MKKSKPALSPVSVSIIGAGRLGTALAHALSGAHPYRVDAVVAKTAHRTELPAGIVQLTLRQLDALPSSDVLFIATPDDQINASAHALADHLRQQSPARRGIALHASGAVSSAALAPLREAGYAVGSLHPLASIDYGAAGAQALAGAHYGIEGETAAREAARRIVRALGGESFIIKPKHKALYHAAAVMSAGHLVALLDAAIEMLVACGLGERRARRLLVTLASGTLHNLYEQPAAQALTGPFARADLEVVRRHLAALHRLGNCNTSDIYLALGQRELQLAARRISQSKLKAIAHELAEALLKT